MGGGKSLGKHNMPDPYELTYRQNISLLSININTRVHKKNVNNINGKMRGKM